MNTKTKKKYISPTLEITEFECEDVITVSTTRELKKSITGNEPYYQSAGKKSWSDIYSN